MDMNKIMKTLYIGLLLLFCLQEAAAQSMVDGNVTVSELAVSRSEDKLFVSMDMDVSNLKVKSNREVVLTPVLTEGTDTLFLPGVMVAGRNRYYHHLRNGLEKGMTLYQSGKIPEIEYRTVVPYAKWMSKATLRMENETCGCCSENLAEESKPLLVLHLKPKNFVPEYVYVCPKAEQKINVLEGSAYIDFPVNRTEIYEDYRRNTVELQKILATIDAVKKDTDARILSVKIKGYASPESPYSNNERLAKGRTETLKNYVRRKYDFPASSFITEYEPEDWSGLECYVENSNLENKEGILSLIRSKMDPDAKEQRIKRTYPKEYAFLLKEVYPGLRHSDYAVKYEVRAYTDVEEIKHLLKTQPQKLSLQEMYLAAQTMEMGSDEFNETFEIAVRMFPDDEVANLNVANVVMSSGKVKNVEQYLVKAANLPEAVYARGIYAALKGDYDAAAKYFTEAARRGVKEGYAALRQLEEITK